MLKNSGRMKLAHKHSKGELNMFKPIIQLNKEIVKSELKELVRNSVEESYSSGRRRGVQGYCGKLLERSFPHPSRTFKTDIVNDSEHYSVIYLLSFSQRSQRCCYSK